jgi:transcription-repair coupling factor (superfamily II helicase)
MSLNGLRTALGQDESFARLRAHAAKPAGARSEDLQIGAPVGLRAALIAEMVDGLQSGIVLAVTATGREAEDLAAALRCYLPPASVEEFPSWETLPHERLSPRSDTVGRRLSVLRRAAASWMSSRPPRTIRCGSNSSVTKWTRCAGSPWRTSGRSAPRESSTPPGCTPRRAASC